MTGAKLPEGQVLTAEPRAPAREEVATFGDRRIFWHFPAYSSPTEA